MQKLFETDRLKFCKFSETDAEAFYLLNSDEEVMRYTGDVAFESIEASRAFLFNYDPYSITGFGRWTVLLKSTNTIIGWCGLKRLEDGTVDLGYRFFKEYWNNGYATEAAKACLKEGFNVYGLDEIIGRTAKKNLGSIRVLEKIGMTFFKEAPCEGIENSVYYKITKQNFGRILPLNTPPKGEII